MIKISFLLKELDKGRDNWEHITIDSPRKILEGELVGLYACEVYLPIPDIEKKYHLIYSSNPIDALLLASEFAKSQLQFLINRGRYIVSEAENHVPWELEKKDPQVYLQEKINELKNNKNLSEEDKEKILGILKESFGKIPHMKDKF